MLRIFSKNANTASWSDEELLSRYVREGSDHHLGVLFERYMPMVYGICLKILKDSGKAEDAVINIYEEVTAKAQAHEIGAFRGWLYVLARNHCLMELRKAQRRPLDFHAPESMDRFDAIEAAFEFELPQKELPLQECLETLQELQRKCVAWFYYEDKSYKDISSILGIDLGKVRSHIQNGRRNLRICLENAR